MLGQLINFARGPVLLRRWKTLIIPSILMASFLTIPVYAQLYNPKSPITLFIIAVVFIEIATIIWLISSTVLEEVLALFFLVFIVASIADGSPYYFFGLLIAIPFFPLALLSFINIRFNLEKRAYFLLILVAITIMMAFANHEQAAWAFWQAHSIPIVIPGLDWKIPGTDALGFPFALIGFYNSPIAAGMEGASHARIIVFSLYALAFFLFIFARILLEKGRVLLEPGLVLCVFSLLVLSFSFEILSHANGFPIKEKDMDLVLAGNRIFALVMLVLLLFWRETAKASSETVPGANGLFYQAMTAAEDDAKTIGGATLFLIWLYTQLSHVWPGGFPDLVTKGMCFLASFPFIHALNFVRKQRKNPYYQQYMEALKISRRSPNPPPAEPSPEDIDRGLNGRGGGDPRPLNDDGN